MDQVLQNSNDKRGSARARAARPGSPLSLFCALRVPPTHSLQTHPLQPLATLGLPPPIPRARKHLLWIFLKLRACLTDARFTCLVHSLFRALPVPRPPCPPAPSLSRALPTLSHMWDEQGPPASAGVKERSPERGMMHRARAQILAADLEEITCHGSSP